MGARSRRKGHRFELEVAALLTKATGLEHKRRLTEVREGNQGDIETPLPLTVQCKVGARPNPAQALREAQQAAPKGHHPVAITRTNGAGKRPPTDTVTLPLEDFLEMLELLTRHGLWR